jgi:hypothetical protein
MGKGEENEIYRPTLPDDDESPLGPYLTVLCADYVRYELTRRSFP